MPAYASINVPVQQAVPGLPAYLIGSFDYGAATGNFTITNGSRSGSTATLTVTVIEGNLPIVGQLISVLCANSNFNVDQVAISAVSFDATTGIGTIQYTTTGSGTIASAATTGQVKAFVPEVGETLADMVSLPLSIQENVGPDNGREVTFTVTMTGSPTATVSVETSMVNIGAQFTTLSAVSTNLNFSGTAGTKTVIVSDLNTRFVRFRLATTSGSGSPTVVAKVLV